MLVHMSDPLALHVKTVYTSKDCEPGASSSRPVSDDEHWQDVNSETERTLSTVASSQATSATVLYHQQQLHCLHACIIITIKTAIISCTVSHIQR